MQTNKPKTTYPASLRRAMIHVAQAAQDRVEQCRPVRAMEDALRRAVDKRIGQDPGFVPSIGGRRG